MNALLKLFGFFLGLVALVRGLRAYDAAHAEVFSHSKVPPRESSTPSCGSSSEESNNSETSFGSEMCSSCSGTSTGSSESSNNSGTSVGSDCTCKSATSSGSVCSCKSGTSRSSGCSCKSGTSRSSTSPYDSPAGGHK